MAKYVIVLFLFMGSFLTNKGQATCILCSQKLNFYLLPDFYTGVLSGFNGGYDLKCRKVMTNCGYYLGVKIGKNFSSFKFEGEVMWQRNTPHSFKVGSMFLDHISGNIQVLSLMANGFTDFYLKWPVRPFIGMGLGYAQTYGHWNGTLKNYMGNFFEIKEKMKFSFNKGGFAFQVIAGLKYIICLELEASLEYRYFDITNGLSNHKFGLAFTRIF